MEFSRRTFLGVCGSAALLPSVSTAASPAFATMSPNGSRYTPAVGNKFFANGAPRPFSGSTQLSHIPPQSAFHRALCDLLAEASEASVMKKFVLMPPGSLHMTLMNGIDDEHRYAPYWPKDVPANASMQSAREWCATRLKGIRTGRTGDFRMVRRKVESSKLSSFTVMLQPVDAKQDAEMRRIRNQLSTVLQIRDPRHDSYGFHITLGYLLEYLTSEEAVEFASLYTQWMDKLFEAFPVITIAQPEFTTFNDMFRFKTEFLIPD